MAVWVEIKCYSVVYFDCVTVFHSKTALYLRTRISGLALITRHPLGVRVTCSKFKVHCAAPYRDVYNVVQKTKSGLHKHIRLCTGGDYRKWHNFRPMENSLSKESRQIRSARAFESKAKSVRSTRKWSLGAQSGGMTKSHNSTGQVRSVKTVLHSSLRLERKEIVPYPVLHPKTSSSLLTQQLLQSVFEIGGFWTVLVEGRNQLQWLISLEILWSLLSWKGFH